MYVYFVVVVLQVCVVKKKTSTPKCAYSRACFEIGVANMILPV
jgi:hypothetical protein